MRLIGTDVCGGILTSLCKLLTSSPKKVLFAPDGWIMVYCLDSLVGLVMISTER